MTAGSATVARSGATLTVDQTSLRAIIDWSSFSIGQGGKVVIDDGVGATLNRITGGSEARIEGDLSGTGSIYVIDPAGVIIGKSGVVNVGHAFAASTLDLSSAQFLAGGTMAFAGSSGASVINLGKIGALGGDVALIGARVENLGTIDASHGDVGLAAGYAVVLSDSSLDGGQFEVVLGGAGTLAANKGTIDAAQAELRANGGNVYALAGNSAGVIDATGVNSHDGQVFLTAGPAGRVEIDGTVKASAKGGAGGTIVATGGTLGVGASARLSASGTSGGTVLLGGDIHGGAEPADDFVSFAVADAKTTSIAKGATIAANGTAGAGGDVVVWSADRTKFQGAIAATGTSQGGFAEVSSHDLLGFLGTADLTAAAGGKTGTLLLDPENVTISSADTSGGSISGGTFTPTADNSILNAATLETALASANVTVSTGSSGSQTGDITVAAPLAWSANTLTLDAYHSIYIQAAVAPTTKAGLVLTTDDGGTGGDYYFDGGNITFGYTSEKLTINGTAYKVLRTLAGIEAITTTPDANYALGAELNGTSSWTPVTLDGRFEGLGNTVTNMTISGSNGSDIGFFGASSGLIRDFGLVNVNVSVSGCYYCQPTGSGAVGGLVANNTGTIINSYVTGTVTGLENVGLLVGANSLGGVINGTYTAGSAGGEENVGGLVGLNAGTITNAYSFAAVGSSGYYAYYYSAIGGLVGTNEATLTDVYSAGGVSGYSEVGGLVGYNNGSINNGYWDTQTSNQTSGVGAPTGAEPATAATTAQLQGSLPAGFVGSAWGSGAGLFPYLNWQFAGTPQAISGQIFEASGTPISGQTISVLVQGANDVIFTLPSATNGYYYDLLAPGSIAAGGSAVIAYQSAGSSSSSAHVEELTGSASDFNLVQSLLIGPVPSGSYQAASMTSLQAQDQTLLVDADGSNSTASSVVTDLTHYGYVYAGGNFAIDVSVTQSAPIYVETTAPGSEITVASSVTLSSSAGAFLFANGPIAINAPLATDEFLDLYAGGAVTQSASGAISGGLVGTAGGAVTLNTASANAVTTLGGFSAASFALTDAATLTITGALSASGCCVSLTTTGSSASILIEAPIENPGHTVTLVSAGEIYEYSGGSITAETLTGSAVTTAYLDSANNFADLDGFTADSLTVADIAPLTVTGALTVSGCCTTLSTSGAGNNLLINAPISDIGQAVYLYSSGAISQSSAGTIDALKLSGDSSDAATLTALNSFSDLAGFTASSGGLDLVDVTAITITGSVTATGGISLTTTGTNNNITIEAGLSDTGIGDSIDLVSTGAITQYSSGSVYAFLLGGSAVGSVTLRDYNQIQSLGAFSATELVVTTASSLTVAGALNVSGCCTTLTTTGSGNDLSIVAPITDVGHTLNLVSGGDISQSPAGIITVLQLEGTSNAGVTLTAPNSFTDLVGFTAGEGLAIAGTSPMTVTGAVSVSGGPTSISAVGGLTVNSAISDNGYNLTLTTTGTGGDIAIDAALGASGETVDLVSTGAISQTSAGAITALALAGSAVGDAKLNAANVITDLGPFTAGSLQVTDAGAMTVDGALLVSGCCTTLTTTGAHDSLTLDARLSDVGHAVNLVSAADLTEGSSGLIVASELIGTVTGDAVLIGLNNHLVSLGAFTAAQFEFTNDAALSVTGNLTVSGCCTTITTLGAGHNLAINADLTDASHTINLVSAGTITESSTAVITADQVEGTSVGAATLTGANVFTDLVSFDAGGALAITDAATMRVTGVVDTGAFALTLTTTGGSDDMALDAGVTAGSVDLVAGGFVTQTSAGVITAKSLKGSAGTTWNLTAANQVANLGALTTTGALSFTDAASLITAGTVSSGTGPLTLTTTGTGHNLAIESEVTTSGTLTLDSAGSAAEYSPGYIVAGTLDVTATTGIDLSSTSNKISTVGVDTTTSGINKINP